MSFQKSIFYKTPPGGGGGGGGGGGEVNHIWLVAYK